MRKTSGRRGAGGCWWLGCLLLGSWACGDAGRNSDQGKESPTRAEKATPRTAPVPADAGADTEARIPPVEAAPAPDPRQERLRREWERYADVVIEHSVADLPAGEREFARRLFEAAGLVEEIHLLQIHPSNVEWRDRIGREGTELERRLFHRYQAPWCLDDPDPGCSTLAPPPPREYGRGLWPADLGPGEVQGLARLINGRELRSPFTVVERGPNGRLRAVPFAASAELGPRMARLAAKLREAAKTAPHPSMKKFLRSRADAFESRSPFPYDASDDDWLRLQGEWEVTVGPYETYDCPHGVKALFQMWIGRVDPLLTAEIRRLYGDLQGLNAALAGLLGQDVYAGRGIDPRGPLRAVDVWIAAGDARRERGAILAYHLPNRGGAAAAGLARKVVLANHGPPFEAASRARAERMLDGDLAALLDARAGTADVAFHELAHGLGLDNEARILDPQGRATTVGAALRGHATLVEELKADALGMWLLGFAKGRGWVEEGRERVRYVAAVVHWLGLIQAPLSDVHGQMAAVQLGWHLKAGSLAWSTARGRLGIDFEKMPGVAQTLAAEVLRIQLAGDHAGARALVERFLEPVTGGPPTPRGLLSEVRTVAIERAADSGVPDPTLRYVVHDQDGAPAE
ncbi:MAG TPA: hypothetical protein VM285_10580 [Polyangia bacterium]|nr:hypothetical protein [Polyangia bacterium]